MPFVCAIPFTYSLMLCFTVSCQRTAFQTQEGERHHGNRHDRPCRSVAPGEMMEEDATTCAGPDIVAMGPSGLSLGPYAEIGTTAAACAGPRVRDHAGGGGFGELDQIRRQPVARVGFGDPQVPPRPRGDGPRSRFPKKMEAPPRTSRSSTGHPDRLAATMSWWRRCVDGNGLSWPWSNGEHFVVQALLDNLLACEAPRLFPTALSKAIRNTFGVSAAMAVSLPGLDMNRNILQSA